MVFNLQMKHPVPKKKTFSKIVAVAVVIADVAFL